MNKRLLIQACSSRKIQTDVSVPALQLYDGTAHRVIRKYLRENINWQKNLRILILSAEYGLISSENLISMYDRRMTKERCQEMQTQIQTFWQIERKINSITSVFINIGGDYLPALAKLDLPEKTKYAKGSIGFRNSNLKKWLNG